MDLKSFRELCEKADAAGTAAVEVLQVIPMVVGSETTLFSGKLDYTKPTYFVADGLCGFAWISITPEYKGNTSLGKEERKVLEAMGFRKNDYEKTYQLSVSAFNQSIQKKEAYAAAYAKVLRSNGIRAYSNSRLD